MSSHLGPAEAEGAFSDDGCTTARFSVVLEMLEARAHLPLLTDTARLASAQVPTGGLSEGDGSNFGPRRIYRLDPRGQAKAEQALAEYRQCASNFRFPVLR